MKNPMLRGMSSVSRVGATAVAVLMLAGNASAGMIRAEDGQCDPGVPELGNWCSIWTGQEFTVTEFFGGDFWHQRASLPNAFDIWWGGAEGSSNGLRFERSRDFTLTSLDLYLGYDTGFPEWNCAHPMEVRSSKGGYAVIEPQAGDTTCYLDSGVIVAWPWSRGGTNLVFSGEEWTSIDWFTVGFIDVRGPMWPDFTRAQVRVNYVPEPAAAVFMVLGLLAAYGHRRERGSDAVNVAVSSAVDRLDATTRNQRGGRRLF